MTHDPPDLTDVRAALAEHEHDITYVAIARESPRSGTFAKFTWSLEEARDRGLLDTDEDLVESCVRWLDNSLVADVQAGMAESYRVRINVPGREPPMVQRTVRMVPTLTLEQEVDDTPLLSDDVMDNALDRAIATLERGLASVSAEMRASLVEQRAMYRQLLADRAAFTNELRASLREVSEDRRMLLEAHVERELGVLRDRESSLERLAREQARAADEAGRNGFFEGLADTAARVWAAQNDLSPDLVAALLQDAELRDLVSDPKLVDGLRDPEMRANLRTFLEAM